MTLEVSVDEFGRVAIPDEMLQALGWQPGTVLTFEQTDDGWVVRLADVNAPTNTASNLIQHGHRRSLRGILRNPNGPSYPTEEALKEAIAASHGIEPRHDVPADQDVELAVPARR